MTYIGRDIMNEELEQKLKIARRLMKAPYRIALATVIF